MRIYQNLNLILQKLLGRNSQVSESLPMEQGSKELLDLPQTIEPEQDFFQHIAGWD